MSEPIFWHIYRSVGDWQSHVAVLKFPRAWSRWERGKSGKKETIDAKQNGIFNKTCENK
jgi:hypothetical protein